MLPSLGFQEILLLGVLALLVVGPKDLPLLFRKLGRWTAKLRGMAQEFRTGFDELARQAELDELKREVEALRRTTSVTEIAREITRPLPTLEEYAGLPKSPPPVPALDAPEGAPATAEPRDPPAAETGPAEAGADEARETAPALDIPEHADAAPLARRAP